MQVSVLPQRGGVVFDSRDVGRTLRVSGQSGEVVLSIWRDDACVATHHVLTRDMPELIRLLAASMIEPME